MTVSPTASAASCIGVPPSHWRDCHFADALSPSLLKHLLKTEGGCSRMTVSPMASPSGVVARRVHPRAVLQQLPHDVVLQERI